MNKKALRIAILAVCTLSLTARGEEPSPSAPVVESPTPAPSAQEQAKNILNDLRLIDACVDQYAIENNLPAGTAVTIPQLALYLKKGTILYKALTDPSGPKDRLGNAMGPFVVDQLPAIPAATANAFADIVPETFWSPFPVGK